MTKPTTDDQTPSDFQMISIMDEEDDGYLPEDVLDPDELESRDWNNLLTVVDDDDISRYGA